MNSKYEKTLRLSAQLIRLDVLHGHLGWKVTDLSRVSKVARSVIYETLGANKKAMLHFALKMVLEELYGLSIERQKAHQDLSGFDAFMRSRALVNSFPELLSFYFRGRDRKDEIGKMIQSYEKKYLAAVSQQTGVTDPSDLLFVRTVIHGVSLAPFLSDSEVRQCMTKLFELIKKK